MSNYIQDLQWRYATKKFDPTKKIDDKDLDFLKDAMQLSASSYGLQPYEILIIEDAEIREKLKPAAWNQTQITDAAYVIVIANKTDFDDSLVDEYITNVMETRGLKEEDLKQYADFMKTTLAGFTKEQKAAWTANQTYIVLGNLLSAAAINKIDACPMEGFEAEKFNEILDLSSKNLNASVIATIGYRHDDDATQHYAKVRKPKTKLFKNI
ncbi:NAD(P)H-dependent oxidoreductase [Patiriisocius hiemis]|uniref:NAD(P)H-dependent oxidoreductase n=1 Tax=Patiriisocius hiemis TaxID=3075604 RepID=A0ABU2YEC3_9FLAO|nr:NAD(P)H-dependent oxidoreductase [Constantimarinum sp. W242]MDT0555989.1 NAD(P)H-dependent oxidoreductase [Constantimarinum sp. W242]